MCGRFTITSTENFYTRYGMGKFQLDLEKSYNIAPGTFSYTIVKNVNKHIAEKMKWGLIPFWAKDQKIGYKLINARSETAHEKPAFRSSFKQKRCLVPASGFYEWQKLKDRKQPYYIKLKNTDLFSFAGLYDEWKDAGKKVLKSFTILTTTPNKILKDIHNRMPVILKKENEKAWLSKTTPVDELITFMRPYPSRTMELVPVSSLVNNPKNNSEKLIQPIK